MANYECFKNQVAVVVGGANGIGRSCAVLLAKQGAKVVVVDVADEAGEELAGQVEQEGGWLRYLHGDATRPEEMAKAAAASEEVGQVRVLINCVGGWTKYISPLTLTPEEWDTGIQLNLHSVFYACVAFARYMKQHGGGSIVNISSIAARIGTKASPIFYPVGKAGVEAISRVLAAEWGRDGIRVISVAPGTTLSARAKGNYPAEKLQEIADRTARGKLAEPDEQAAAILFLASDDAVHVTGATLYVNGGQVIFP